MTRNSILFSLLISIVLIVSCQWEDPAAPEPIGPDPIPWQTVHRDSITTGSYMGIAIGQTAAASYESIRKFPVPQGLDYLTVSGRQTADIGSLASTLPLYHTIMIDERKGTDAGLQITITRGVVTALYLNSGKKLTRWPEKGNVYIAIGNFAEDLHGRLVNISKGKSHAKRFERISLLNKDLRTAFDPKMADSPGWAFAYLKSDGTLEQVSIHLSEGKVKALVIKLMRQAGI
jgi:hypothetical protein